MRHFVTHRPVTSRRHTSGPATGKDAELESPSAGARKHDTNGTIYDETTTGVLNRTAADEDGQDASRAVITKDHLRPLNPCSSEVYPSR
jgi:hypothetical protein